PGARGPGLSLVPIPGAVVRGRQDRRPAQHRRVVDPAGPRRAFTVRAVEFPGPVGTGYIAFEAAEHLEAGVAIIELALAQFVQVLVDLERLVRIGAAVQDRAEICRGRIDHRVGTAADGRAVQPEAPAREVVRMSV